MLNDITPKDILHDNVIYVINRTNEQDIHQNILI